MRPEGRNMAHRVPCLNLINKMTTDQQFFRLQAEAIKRIGQMAASDRKPAKIQAIKKINRLYSAVLISVTEYRQLLNLIFAQ